MSLQSKKHRAAFLAVRELLQKIDPLGLMPDYRGDKFEDQIYGYEATTILEQTRDSQSAHNIEAVLNDFVKSKNHDANTEAISDAAEQISRILNAL